MANIGSGQMKLHITFKISGEKTLETVSSTSMDARNVMKKGCGDYGRK